MSQFSIQYTDARAALMAWFVTREPQEGGNPSLILQAAYASAGRQSQQCDSPRVRSGTKKGDYAVIGRRGDRAQEHREPSQDDVVAHARSTSEASETSVILSLEDDALSLVTEETYILEHVFDPFPEASYTFALATLEQVDEDMQDVYQDEESQSVEDVFWAGRMQMECKEIYLRTGHKLPCDESPYLPAGQLAPWAVPRQPHACWTLENMWDCEMAQFLQMTDDVDGANALFETLINIEECATES